MVVPGPDPAVLVPKAEWEGDKRMLEIEKLRADLHNDQCRINFQMFGLLVGAVADAATLLAAAARS